jgi:sulfur relay (sulfurtransferase) complex TusBCD TusD component (DsrE family)
MQQSYLLIASDDPFTSKAVESFYGMARDLAGAGHPVTLFLVQNGVLPARRGARAGDLAGLAGTGVRILAEEFSLRERGIADTRLADGIQPAPLDHVVDALAAGTKVLWQ